MSEKLVFDLLTGKNDLSKSLDSATQQAAQLSSIMGGLSPTVDQAKKAVDSAGQSVESFVSSTLKVAGGLALFSAVERTISFITSSISDSVKAYADQEEALNQLNQSLKITGSYSESAVQGVEAFATSLESVSKYSDDSIIKQIAFARSLGMTTEQAKETIKAAANMSATLGGSLEENVEKLGRSFSGTLAKGLDKLIPGLKSLTKAQLEAGEAATLINAKFSGASANELNTYNGQLAKLKNNFNNAQESMGAAIVKSSIFQSIITTSTKILGDYNRETEVSNALSLTKGNRDKLNSQTTEQLQIKQKLLNDEIAVFQKMASERKGQGFFENLITPGSLFAINKQIDSLVLARTEIDKRLASGAAPKEKIDIAPPKQQSTEELDAANKRAADLKAIDSQLVLERSQLRSAEINQIIGEELGRNELEIQRIYEFNAKKAEIDAAQKEESLSVGLTAEDKKAELLKISREKELALLTLNNKKELDLLTGKLAAEKKADDAAIKQKITNLGYLNSETQAAFAFGAAVAKDGSKEQFLINKAAALAQAAIAWSTGIANSLLLPPPANLVAEANANRVGALSVATIAATTLKGFAGGGIVGATTGADNRIASIRDGEMVLNANQQKNLFDMINNGGTNSPIIIQVDGREIARAVRNQIQGGFVLA